MADQASTHFIAADNLFRHYRRSIVDLEAAFPRAASVGGESEGQFDYVDVSIVKPWGSEYLLYSGLSSAVWLLEIGPGHQTSMHCHRYKSTSLVVLRGEVACSNLQGQIHLRSGDALSIEAGAFHQTRAVGGSGALVLEVETPPAKHDLLRFSDQYGRQGQGCEGRESAIALPQGTTVQQEDCNISGVERHIGEYTLSMFRPSSSGGRSRIASWSGSEVGTLLEGPDVVIDGRWALPVGAFFRTAVLRDISTWSPGTVLGVLTSCTGS